MRRLVLLAFFLLSAAPCVTAEDHPNIARGFQADRLYQIGDLDNVNRFNGNLITTIPIGDSYQVGTMNLQMNLVYNSSVWDYEATPNITCVEDPARPDQSTTVAPFTMVYPSYRSNAGMGWALNFGLLNYAHKIPNKESGEAWTYYGPDGASHRFFTKVLHNTASENADADLDIAPPLFHFTRDGSYLRLDLTHDVEVVHEVDNDGNPIDTLICMTPIVEFPNGEQLFFEKDKPCDPSDPNCDGFAYLNSSPFGDYRPKKRVDRFGNEIRFLYSRTNDGGVTAATWSIQMVPRLGPSRTIAFTFVHPAVGSQYTWVLKRVSLPGVNESVYTYTFDSTSKLIMKEDTGVAVQPCAPGTPCEECGYCSYPDPAHPLDVRGVVTSTFLDGITLPSGERWSMEYNGTSPAPETEETACNTDTVFRWAGSFAPANDAWRLSRLTLPTGGIHEYTYQDWFFTNDTPVKPKQGYVKAVVGIASRTIKERPTAAGDKWVYTNQMFRAPDALHDSFGIVQVVNGVRPPKHEGRRQVFDVARFSVCTDLEHLCATAYGLPMTSFQLADTDEPVTEEDMWLSTQTFVATTDEENVSCDVGTNPRPAVVFTRDGRCQLLRSEYVKYFVEGLGSDGKEQRLEATKTVNGASPHDCSPTAEGCVTTRYSNFDGLGHYRTTTISGSYPSNLVRTTTTQYNAEDALVAAPGSSHWGIISGTCIGACGEGFHRPSNADPWILNLSAGSYGEEVSGNRVTKSRTITAFDKSTGSLTRKRVLRAEGHPGFYDTSEAGGHDLLLPGSHDLVSEYVYDAEGRVTSEVSAGGDNGTVDLTSLANLNVTPAFTLAHSYEWHTTFQGCDATVKSYTIVGGEQLNSSDRTFDCGSGQLKTERDPAGTSTETRYEYDYAGRLQHVTLPATTVDARSVQARSTFTYTPFSADPLVRASVSITATDGIDSLGEIRAYYDGLGRLSKEDELLPSGDRKAKITEYNARGWVSKVRQPEDTSPATTMLYDELGRVVRTTSPDGSVVTTDYTGDRQKTITAKVNVSDTATKTQILDFFGRLVSVKENSGNTGYDGTTTVVSGSEAETTYEYDLSDRLTRVAMGSQTRLFKYDSAGLLMSESQPELVTASSNGTVSYTYDAGGRVVSKQYAAGAGALFYFYDAAGRLLKLRPTNDANSACDSASCIKEYTYGRSVDGFGFGKVKTATRYSLPDYRVTETYSYGPMGVQTRDTAVYQQTTLLQTFNQGFERDALGALKNNSYPSCAGSCSELPLTVSNTFRYGYLTKVASPETEFVRDILYSRDGSISIVKHGSSKTGVNADDHYATDSMGRIKDISFQGTYFFGGENPCSLPTITSQPQDRTIVVGQTTTLTVGTSGGSGNFVFQWYQSVSGGPFEPISGANSSSYVANPTVTTVYKLGIVCGANEPLMSQTATVTVTSTVCTVAIPGDYSCLFAGSSPTLSAQATGTAPIAYQWWIATQKTPYNWVADTLPAGHNSYYQTTPGWPGDFRAYKVVATCANGTSEAIKDLNWDRLTVTDNGNDLSICYGSSATITVAGDGDNITNNFGQPSVKFDWWNGIPLSRVPHDGSASSPTLTSSALTVRPFVSSKYWCELSNLNPASCQHTIAVGPRTVTVTPVFDNFTVSPTNAPGGTVLSATFRLERGPDFAGFDVKIDLMSSNPAVAHFETNSITIPSGQSTGTVNVITSSSVAAPTDVTLSASTVYSPRIVKTVDVRVRPPAVASVTFAPSQVAGAATVVGTVTLDVPAWSESQIYMEANYPILINGQTAPRYILIPMGARTQAFTAGGVEFTTARDVVVQATLSGESRQGTFRVLPKVGIVFDPTNMIPGGSRATGRVTIPEPVQSGVARVSLTTGDDRLVVPPYVDIPAGQTTATFYADAEVISSSFDVMVTASYLGAVNSAVAHLLVGQLAGIDLSSTVIRGGDSQSAIVRTSAPVSANYTFGMYATNQWGGTSTVIQPPTQGLLAAGRSEKQVTIGTTAVSQTYVGNVVAYQYNGPETVRSALQVVPDYSYNVESLSIRSGGGSSKLEWNAPSLGTADYFAIYSQPGACPATVPAAMAWPLLARLNYSSHGSYTHNSTAQTCYAVYTYRTAGSSGYQFSSGRMIQSRPPASGPISWSANARGSGLVAPAVGAGVVLVPTNDRTLFGMGSGSSGGFWVSGMTSPARSVYGGAYNSPPVISQYNVSGHTQVAFSVASDGIAACTDAVTGQRLWFWTLAESPTAGPAVALNVPWSGGTYNLLVTATHNMTQGNSILLMNPSTGSPYVTYNQETFGPVTNNVVIDSANRRIYFTSRRRYIGSTHTLWCLQFTPGATWSVSKLWSADIGNADGTPVLRNGRVYAGNNAGNVYCLDAVTGTELWNFPTGNGIVKGAIVVDPAATPTRIYFSTTNYVWALNDNGTSASLAWQRTDLPAPTQPVLAGTRLYVGSSNGWLYQITSPGSTPSVNGISLGGGTVGTPASDASLLYVGTESGTVFGVTYPF